MLLFSPLGMLGQLGGAVGAGAGNGPVDLALAKAGGVRGLHEVVKGPPPTCALKNGGVEGIVAVALGKVELVKAGVDVVVALRGPIGGGVGSLFSDRG